MVVEWGDMGGWIPAFAGMTDWKHRNYMLVSGPVSGMEQTLRQAQGAREEWIPIPCL